MKYFIAIALLVAVASAGLIKPTPASQEEAQLQEIIAAINNPATNPATAAALEQMLQDILGVKPDPVIVVDEAPANDFVDIFPVVDPVAPSEDFVDIMPVLDSVAPAPAAASSSPLVQIIVNVNQAAAAAPGPAVVPSPADVDAPLDFVDIFPVFDSVSPVQVVDTAPVAVEPVNIGTPVIPAPAVNLPEILN
ncbi:uncharacterized protein LOC142980044 [Anticarsia gemmatalis]|uniref:uncharacterized protein LOC142980044 n=1 Tax=Anticarsia gemmatalis TaxID=129554 RepID=UPI003F77086D